MFTRRHMLGTAFGAGAASSVAGLMPAWARSATDGNLGIPHLTGTQFDLSIGKFPIRINGRATEAVGVNGSVPAPLIRFREGDEITLNVTNTLDVDSSIHWHGLLVPFQMDGVPGVTFPGIKPGETFTYKYAVPQNGTYWYHSHSGLQEQVGHYGPMIIDPKDADPVQYDREYVLMLGDWTYENPHHLFAKLKKNAESLNFNRPSIQNPMGLGGMWGAMRMNPGDLADISGETYTYVINGHATADNWTAIFKPGERVRLRIINAAAMTLFNVRIPGLPMTIVNADGLNVQPLEVDELQMGVAETYDVIVEPKEDQVYGFVAESIDRSGQVVATLATRAGMRAPEPALRPVPTLTMRDMGMDHGGHASSAGHDNHDMMGDGGDHEGHNMPDMDDAMDHGSMGPDPHGASEQLAVTEASIERGPGVANVAMMPVSRLDEPGIGLETVPHRALRYSDLRSLERNPDLRAPEREVVVHLTSNMERYMWSFDGVKFSEVTRPILFHEGERVRLTMINNTMMPHPIHLHGMFFDVVNGGGDHKPRKHTIIVKPGEKLSVDVSADHVGDWAFHCHLIYHMHAGMMQVVTVMPHDMARPDMDHEHMDHDAMDHEGMSHGDMHTSEMDGKPTGHGSMGHGSMTDGETER